MALRQRAMTKPIETAKLGFVEWNRATRDEYKFKDISTGKHNKLALGFWNGKTSKTKKILT